MLYFGNNSKSYKCEQHRGGDKPLFDQNHKHYLEIFSIIFFVFKK